MLAEYQKALAEQLVSIDKSREPETEITANNSVAIVDRLTDLIDRLSQKQEQLWAVVRAMATKLSKGAGLGRGEAFE